MTTRLEISRKKTVKILLEPLHFPRYGLKVSTIYGSLQVSLKPFPKLWLASVPLASFMLRALGAADIMGLLRDISAKGKTILMATHNYNLILKYPSRIIKCDEGTVIDSKK